MRSSPKFKNPPVVETAIGVQFPEIPGFGAVHFGLFWDRIKERYKRYEDQIRLHEVAEPFPRKLPLPESTLRLSHGATPQRVWYVSESEAELIQLQPDRFFFNWRGPPETSEPYPSYNANSKRFLEEFDGFVQFCRENSLEEPSPNLCEVTYINNMVPHPGETGVELFGKVFTGLRWETSDSRLPVPEAAVFNRVYVIEGQVGRLYAEAAIAVRQDEPGEIVRCTLTARVNHKPEGGDSLEDSLRLAHDWVVHGFVSITDPGIQKERWEKTS